MKRWRTVAVSYLSEGLVMRQEPFELDVQVESAT